ncbi:MAG: potassium channel family protein [Actinomycetales bacterium]|nr:potassium channel family protein [Actinomycetales bacterium]
MSLDYFDARDPEAKPEVAETRIEHAVHTWERWSSIPLAVLALVYLALYAFEVLADFEPATLFDIVLVNDVIWGIFIVDFVIRFFISQNKGRFIKRNLVELVSLILPFFRAFRMFRVIIAIGFLTRVAQSLQGKINVYLGLILPLLVFTCSLGVYEAEHTAPGANITNFGDAVWWAFVTITTIGYGDYYPVTLEGRAIAVLLMLSGLALVSLITISLGSWFLSRLEIDLNLKSGKSRKK